MTSDDNSGSFAIILHNVRTYRSAGVVAVIRSKRKAEETLKEYQQAQSSSDHHEGWRYFIEKTSLTPGTEAGEATNQRQAELELRESKEDTTPPSPNPHK